MSEILAVLNIVSGRAGMRIRSKDANLKPLNKKNISQLHHTLSKQWITNSGTPDVVRHILERRDVSMTNTGVSEKEPPYPDEMGDSTYHYDYPFVSSGEGGWVRDLID
jgi:hypothetical protein